MKISNKTRYSTKVLRALFAACMAEVKKEYGLDWSKVVSARVDNWGDKRFRTLKVSVVYARRKDFVSGCAWKGSSHAVIRIPSQWKGMAATRLQEGRIGRTDDLSVAVADTFIHELGHILGVGHVHRWYTIEHKYQEWLKVYVDTARYNLEPPPVVRDKVAARESAKELRFTRAQANLETAQAVLRRAETRVRKWAKKVRYYERTLPAAAAKRAGGAE